MPRHNTTDSTFSSAIYEGSVRHRRNLPKLHQFDFRFFMLMLDLDELDVVFKGRWFWSTRKWTLCRFKQSDHLRDYLKFDSDCVASASDGERELNLKQRALMALSDHGIDTDMIGPIRLLTQLSYLGYSMNPVSFFYCYDVRGEKVEAIIAEVNNTPWGEQHLYVIPSTALELNEAVRSKEIKKDFHVSPFMTLDMNYRMAFSPPGQRLAVKIENHLLDDPQEGDTEAASEAGSVNRKNKIIDVTMSLQRRSWTGSALNWLLVKYPLISFQVVAGIYWQALRLYLKKIPFVPHPGRGRSSEVASVDPNCSQTSVDCSAVPRLDEDSSETKKEVMIG